MPFSLLSVVQHYQDESQDNTLEAFFTEDYYKIEGRSPLHKFKYKPLVLNKLLDHYWNQNPNYLTAVLAKEFGDDDAPEQGVDTLDAQLETRCDELINKILYYLSKLPIYISFEHLQPKMKKLCTYVRFLDYMSAWPQATD